MDTSQIVAAGISDQIANIVASARGGMVKISNGHRGTGAGSIIHPQGLIITNSHVVQRKEVNVHFEHGREV